MPLCTLCKKNEATKLNSHLITWALVKEAITNNASKERDNNVTFSISSLNSSKVHIGRSILPEQIEEILGDSISDSEEIKNKDPLARDNIFCPSCEEGIGKIESAFISKVYKKLENATTLKTFDNIGNKRLVLSNFETNLTTLFVYSIFFRVSIGNFNSYSLKPAIEDNIRLILLSVLSSKQKELENSIDIFTSDKFTYPVLVCYLETTEEERFEENIIMQNKCDTPYFIWANRMVFQLYQKQKQVHSSIQYFYGLSNLVNVNEYLSNKESMPMSICIISNENRNKMVLDVLEYLARIHLDDKKNLFNQLCQKLRNKRATLQETNLFAYHYSNIITQKLHRNVKEPFLRACYATFGIHESNNG